MDPSLLGHFHKTARQTTNDLIPEFPQMFQKNMVWKFRWNPRPIIGDVKRVCLPSINEGPKILNTATHL